MIQAYWRKEKQKYQNFLT